MMSKVLKAFVLFMALGAAAETSVSDVVVNQRWPWSEKVDVDFVLSGEAGDVEVTATWDAHPSPHRLGTLFSAAPGCPSEAFSKSAQCFSKFFWISLASFRRSSWRSFVVATIARIARDCISRIRYFVSPISCTC